MVVVGWGGGCCRMERLLNTPPNTPPYTLPPNTFPPPTKHSSTLSRNILPYTPPPNTSPHTPHQTPHQTPPHPPTAQPPRGPQKNFSEALLCLRRPPHQGHVTSKNTINRKIKRQNSMKSEHETIFKILLKKNFK